MVFAQINKLRFHFVFGKWKSFSDFWAESKTIIAVEMEN